MNKWGWIVVAVIIVLILALIIYALIYLSPAEALQLKSAAVSQDLNIMTMSTAVKI